MSVATDTVISGWINVPFDPTNTAYSQSTDILTVPATTSEQYEGGYIDALDLDCARVPVLSTCTLTKLYSGKLCDLATVASSKQTIDIDTASKDHFIILPVSDEDVADQMVRVKINPNHIGRQGE
jgi:hypothetical protein